MSAAERSIAVINGVRIAAVAQLVAGNPLASSTDERRIARKAQRIGEKLERQGWLPDLRRKRMLDVIVREAFRCDPPGHREKAPVAPQDALGTAEDGETAED